jgi:4-hydroxythreonine-4-phosphate dehydrogenase
MNVSSPIKRIALTAGEPAGIGPDLCLQLAQSAFDCENIVITDPNELMLRAKLFACRWLKNDLLQHLIVIEPK